MKGHITLPRNIDLTMLQAEFGYHAVEFYLARIKQREAEGKVYYNPLKTIYLWATEDRATSQGYYTTLRGYSRGRRRNYGGS